jgi:hypothetical protein
MPGVASRFSVIVAAAGFAEVERMKNNETTQLKTLPTQMPSLVNRRWFAGWPLVGSSVWPGAGAQSSVRRQLHHYYAADH